MPFYHDVDLDAMDEEGRWVFEFAHPCGHHETHRIRLPAGDGTLRFPTADEQRYLLDRFIDEPCNACQLGVEAGRSLKVYRLTPGDGP